MRSPLKEKVFHTCEIEEGREKWKGVSLKAERFQCVLLMKRAVAAAAFPAWKGKASVGQACRDNMLACSVFSSRPCCHRSALTKQQQGRLENFLRNRKVKKYSTQKTASQGW